MNANCYLSTNCKKLESLFKFSRLMKEFKFFCKCSFYFPVEILQNLEALHSLSIIVNHILSTISDELQFEAIGNTLEHKYHVFHKYEVDSGFG